MGRPVSSSSKTRNNLLLLDMVCKANRIEVFHVSPMQARKYAQACTKFFMKNGKIDYGWYWWKLRSNDTPLGKEANGPFKYKIDAHRAALLACNISAFDPKYKHFLNLDAARTKPLTNDDVPKRMRLTPLPEEASTDDIAASIQIDVSGLKPVDMTPRPHVIEVIETDYYKDIAGKD